MKRFFSLLVILSVWFLSFGEAPVKFFDVGEPIKFCGEKYHFAWSQNDGKMFYVQEYLPKVDSFDNLKTMFTVTLLFVDVHPIDAVRLKVAELDERKKNDPIINYQVAENGDMYLLDFIVSDYNGKEMNCVELDIHRYSSVKVNGKDAILLCFYTERAYGDDIESFIKSIPEKRNKLYDEIGKINLDIKFVK